MARFAEADETVQPLARTLKDAVAALAGPERTLPTSDLEVGILEDRGNRRTFVRLTDQQIDELLS